MLFVVALLALAGGGWWLIRHDAGRLWLLAKVSQRIEETSGWRVTADEFRWRRGPNGLSLQNVRVGAPDAEPLLVAERVIAEFDWRDLFVLPMVFEYVEVDGLTVDTTVPLPTQDASKPRTGPTEVPLVIHRLRLDRGTVLGGLSEGWLETWNARGLALDGSVADGAFVASVDAGSLRLVRRGVASPVELSLSGRARGPFTGPYTLQDLDLEGDGIRLEGSGTVGLGDADPLAADFHLRADAQRLLETLSPDLGTASRDGTGPQPGILTARATFDFRDLSGRIDARAEGLPAELLEPFVGSASLDRAAARGTRLDLDLGVDLALGEGVLEAARARGQADVVWRNDSEVLVDATLRTLDVPGDSEPRAPVRAALDAQLLPALAGSRRIEASLTAPSWSELAQVRSDVATIGLDLPELSTFRRWLEERWPTALESLPELPWRGSLNLRADVAGRLDDPQVRARGTWRPGGPSRLDVKLAGRPVARRGTVELVSHDLDLGVLRSTLGLDRLEGSLDGRLDVDLRSRDVSRVSAEVQLVSQGLRLRREPPTPAERRQGSVTPDLVADRMELEGDLAAPWSQSPTLGDLSADLRLALRDTYGNAGPRVEELDVDARLDGGHLRIRRGEGSMRPPPAPPPPTTPEPADTRLTTEDPVEPAETPRLPNTAAAISFRIAGSVHALPELPWSEPTIETLDLRVTVEHPHRSVDRAEFDARLRDGILGVDALGIDLPEGGPAIEELRAYLPLADLGRIPGLEAAIAALPLAERGEGPLRVVFEIPGLDTGGLYRWLAMEPPTEQLRGSISGRLEIIPDDPTRSTGAITAENVEIQLAENTFRSAEPQRITLADRRLSLARGLWSARNRTFDAEATVELDPGWRLDQDFGRLVESFSAVATGSLEAALLNGYLAGGRATGLADVTVLAAGTPEENAAEIDIVGDEETSFSWLSPYATQIVSPTVRLRVEDGIVEIAEANARLNEGQLDVEGVVLDADGQTHLLGFLDRVRYRVDYGMTVLVSGNFELELFSEQPPLLQANLLVERGFLRRQLDPERELISILLQPPEIDVEDVSDTTRNLRLEIDVATVEGVRVRNNLADFHASWAPLEVGGTLAAPFIRGSIEVDPGGKIYAWGQVVRLDRAVLEFSGQPDVPARLDLTTTSSLEDPSIATPNDLRLVAEMAEPVPLGSTESEERRFDSQAFTSGLTTYYGDQLASRLGANLSGPRLEYRPLWIFGESSPEAKLVVSQDLSANVGLAVAFGLREAEERTYLLDFHRFAFLPSLSATAFTNDENNYGATVQQQIDLGGAEEENEDDLPRLDDIVVRCPGCVDAAGKQLVGKGKIRRSVGFRTDDLIPEGSDFDIEIDVAESLRTEGFPDPAVQVDIEPDSDPGYVDILLDIELGPRVTFEFAGEEPPRNRRDSIRSLYRVDYYEATSVEEMKVQTERVWKSLGHPEPEVVVEAERLVPDDPRSDRKVTVRSQPGSTLTLDELIFESTGEPLPERTVRALLHRFSSQVWRVKLAAGDEDAEDRVLRALSVEGFPRAGLVDSAVEDGGATLRVAVEPGPRRKLVSVEIVGLDGEELERARNQLELAADQPFVGSQIAEAAAKLEAGLRSRGFYEAKVHTEIDYDDDEDLTAEVDLIAKAGNRYVLKELRFRGADQTSETWLRDITDLELGTPLDRRKVAEARRKLVETRLFSRVTVDADYSEEGTRLVFDVVEHPRYAIAYGGRWESEGGSGAIFEALDKNFTGRGVDLGLRLLYAEQEERARFYGRVPRLFGDVLELQLFAEVFDDSREELRERGWEMTGQLSRRLTERLDARVYGRYVDQELTDLTTEDETTETERSPLLGVQLVWDSRDRLLDPTRGLLASFDFSGARSFIAADAEYERLYVQLNAFDSLFQQRQPTDRDPRRSWVWSQSLRIGVVETDDVLPRSVRFFAGGPFSVRGYANRSLGPQERNADGSLRAQGGDALLVLNQELRFPLPWEGFQGVLFADAGNVWNEPEDLSLDDLFTSLGFGLRTETPIGIVRLDVGFPLDGRKEDDLMDDDYEVYFGFGHAF